jgi:hypothetical protein
VVSICEDEDEDGDDCGGDESNTSVIFVSVVLFDGNDCKGFGGSRHGILMDFVFC